ncbi:VWA domain-containing protein [Mucilaginibacter conchicola]|uniref:VWA domain-containing protein n=1 Tax=Mucilaginibacter conchicola TaxID=2303333 RepID=A0A372NP36_9SPHI|nr:vWA domain-containing protein [Mucilaginibacter conchicola]RFZ90003.1 VWA domain-containing protein [Mucilaginibacter conchicola]
MNNSKQWSSATPGYIIFLVDQSGSMSESFTGDKNKATFTALVINRTINDLIFTNSAGDKIKDRVFISIIGYGGKGGNSVEDIRSDYLSAFAESPLRLERIKKKISDGGGGLVEIEEEMPVFVEPTANGLTPMGEALIFCKQLIEGWNGKKPDNPAPVIINVTDGFPYEGQNGDEPNKTLKSAKEVMGISTIDGNPLIFNIHIGDGGREVQFEESESKLVDDETKLLFNISSKVPDSYRDAAKKHGFNIAPESRGFVSNAGAETLIKFINFGSSGGTDRIA